MKMSGCKTPPRNDRPSITYRCNKFEGASFDLADVVLDENVSTTSKKKKHSSINTEPKYPEILSTTELISAIGQIWNRVNPLPISESEEKSNHNCGTQKNIILGDLTGEDVGVDALKDDGSYFSVDVRTVGNFTPLVQPKFELLKVTQKICVSLPQLLKGSTKFSNEYWKEKGLASVGILYKYGSMNKRISAESRSVVNVSEIEDKKTDKICISGCTMDHADGSISSDAIQHGSISGCTVGRADGSISRDATHFGRIFDMRSSDFYSMTVKSKDAAFCDNVNVAVEAEQISSLHSDYFLGALYDNNVNGSISWAPNSTLCADYHIGSLAPHEITHGTFQHNIDDNNFAEHTGKLPQKLVAECKNIRSIHSPACEGYHHALAKQEHAYAGAFAGIFVSLCLHPVDTVKTVTQSSRAEQKSICDIGRSIVSERGITGLYRGIASNITSSAPISAIYTFTYESVKGLLLPLISKEYHSLCHCIAGGSASIATSFVFTPSERVKQQMQIGSRYHNCWNALIGIVGKGGLPSLYAGWGAVLCRNVPHSIIKFYTYENLKQLMLSSQKSTAQPNTLQTLVCGGLAGSTAALFTTPFDVVKTRLQTRIPGSMRQYDSVFHALKEIGKTEGLKGLYRGLIPRLVMYVSQGALFFASYEFFKRFFSLEVSQFNAQRIQYKESMEDDPKKLQLPS